LLGQLFEVTRKAAVVLCFFLQSLEDSMNATPIAIAVIRRHLGHPFPAKTHVEPDRHTTVRLLLDQRVNPPRGFLGTVEQRPTQAKSNP